MFSGDLGFNPFDKNHNAIGTNEQIKLRNKFLDSFGGPNIFCYNGDPRKKISSMRHTENLTEVAIANNDQGADAYFYVNGGRKQYAISRVRACFVDMDAGRDSKGQYLMAREVMVQKKKFLDKINSFPVAPSWVVDTRNGYQCYWILNHNSGSPNKTYWNGIQKKLVNYFEGDARAIKINQIYRVPYTWWRKGWEGKKSYFTTILSGSLGTPVNIDDLKNALDGISAVVSIVPNKTSDEWYKGYAKAYKQSDITGVPVSHSVATDIANQLNKQQYSYTNSTDNKWEVYGKTYGVPSQVPFPVPNGWKNIHVEPSNASPTVDLKTDEQQAKLLKTVVEFLNQASTALYFSNNRFLASSAKDLASQISDKFCIG